MQADPKEYGWWAILMVLAGGSLLTLVTLVRYVLLGSPDLCPVQVSALGAIGATAGTFAVLLTLLFAFGQARMQTEQLAYYYRPGLWLRVDYSPPSDYPHLEGLPVRVWAVNQAAVFAIRVRLEKADLNDRADMVEDAKLLDAPERQNCLKPLTRGGPRAAWECGRIGPDEQWWCYIGGWDKLDNNTVVIAEWEVATGVTWERRWRLGHTLIDETSGSGTTGKRRVEWDIRPLKPARPRK